MKINSDDYNVLARRALHGYLDERAKYTDSPMTVERIVYLWPHIAGLGYSPYQLAQLVNFEDVTKEMLQSIYDKLNYYAIA